MIDELKNKVFEYAHISNEEFPHFIKEELRTGQSYFFDFLNVALHLGSNRCTEIAFGFVDPYESSLYITGVTEKVLEVPFFSMGTESVHISDKLPQEFNFLGSSETKLTQILTGGFSLLTEANFYDPKSTSGYDVSVYTPYGLWNFHELCKPIRTQKGAMEYVVSQIPRIIIKDIRKNRFGGDY
jgi:hypothetical protein